MAKRLGNTHRVYVESTTPGTFNPIKGETTLSRSRQSQQIDSTSKDDGAYGTSFAGTKSLSITCGFILDLPDATGAERLFSLATANPSAPFNVQIRKAPYAVGDLVFAGSVNCTGLDDSADLNAMQSISVTLTAAAAPSTDLLG
jgi:hypothetical protein